MRFVPVKPSATASPEAEESMSHFGLDSVRKEIWLDIKLKICIDFFGQNGLNWWKFKYK